MEVRSIFQSGVITLITGNLGSGKTDFAMTLADIARQRGYTILTNVIMLHEVNGVKTVTKASELLSELAQEKDYVTVLDEAILFANSKEILNKDNKRLMKLLMMIRKLGSSIIFINQRDMETAKTIRQLTTYEFRKRSKKEILVFGPWGPSELYIYNIPRTRLPFDTRSIAYFEMDVDIEGLFSELANMNYKRAMAKLREISKKGFEGFTADESRRGAVEKKMKKKEIVQALSELHPEWKPAEIAKAAGVSERYVWTLRASGKA